MRICLRRGRVNPCAENLLRCPHRAARKGNKMPLYSGRHVPRSQSVYYFRVLRPESASMLPQKHLQNGMLGKKKNCQRWVKKQVIEEIISYMIPFQYSTHIYTHTCRNTSTKHRPHTWKITGKGLGKWTPKGKWWVPLGGGEWVEIWGFWKLTFTFYSKYY